MIRHEQISESLYSTAASAIRTLTEHYRAMLSAGVKPEDVLSRMCRHIDTINMSSASEEAKTKAKAELRAFATKNLTTADGWPVAAGLFDGNYVPPGWVKESLYEGATASQAAGTGTHVLFHANLNNRFHGVVNGKQIKPMTEPELHRTLRGQGYDKAKAAEMIANFKSGNASGERLHSSTGMVDSALRHSQAALTSHLAGNHRLRDQHLKLGHFHLDAALDTLNKDDDGVVHHLPKKLDVLHRTLKAISPGGTSR